VYRPLASGRLLHRHSAVQRSFARRTHAA
jgi:hypothetical protein